MAEPQATATDQQRAMEIVDAWQFHSRPFDSVAAEMRWWQRRIAAALAAVRADEHKVHEAVGADLVRQVREQRERIETLTQERDKARQAAEEHRTLRVEYAEEVVTLRRERETLEQALREVEQHCPCGARPESPRTHPHVLSCPVGRALGANADAD